MTRSIHHLAFGAMALLGLTLLPARTAHAMDEESYEGFGQSAGLTLVGSAEIAKTSDGMVLQLAADEAGQASAALATEPVDVASFSTAFSFRMTDPGGLADPSGHVGGDGFTFAIQPLGAALGGHVGHGLGIGGISPSFAVEFDTWDDDCADYPMVCDPSSNHVGIDVNGDVHSVKTANVSPPLDDGNEWFVWIDYDGTVLEVRLSETDERPRAPLVTYAVDMPKLLGLKPPAKAFVGFTASTGGSWQNEDILTWFYATPAAPNGIAAAVDGGTSKDAGAGVRLGGGALACSQVRGAPRHSFPWVAGMTLLALPLLARRRIRRRRVHP